MANGRNPRSGKRGEKAFKETFAAIPKSVLFSPVYVSLSKVERALLLDLVAQYNGRNNGRLLCSVTKLRNRGFTSSDTLHRAKKVLLEAGFIYETVMGHRPNWASWYALTWRPLDSSDRYDPGVTDDFRYYGYQRYLTINPDQVHATRAFLKQKKSSIPSDGVQQPTTVPSQGFMAEYLIPLRGTVSHQFH